MDKTICELFAGVGGFRLGFERLNSGWETVWFSQWEPSTKSQWAHDCYTQHFGDCVDINGEYHTNDDISLVDKSAIPDHTLLVGGFPCQDYSVAQSLSTSKGIEGKKGVLWWQIYDILTVKRPWFCILENVDRLLRSPSKQRGRDFGIILSCLMNLGYSVEWRMVNAVWYGAAQRRRRTFIFAYRNDSTYGKSMNEQSADDILSTKGLMAKAFPVSELSALQQVEISSDVLEVSKNFSCVFREAGYAHSGVVVHTAITKRTIEKPITLGSILQKNVDERFYISEENMDKWVYLKGPKKIPRVSKTGFEYIFSEGAIPLPDFWDKPGRTMLTSEATVNRSSHVVEDPGTLKLRVLTPVEAERLNDFDDNWTDTGMPHRARYFCMGNALVVPMITRMGKVLDKIIEKEEFYER